jgi:hypothetical protein
LLAQDLTFWWRMASWDCCSYCMLGLLCVLHAGIAATKWPHEMARGLLHTIDQQISTT